MIAASQRGSGNHVRSWAALLLAGMLLAGPSATQAQLAAPRPAAAASAPVEAVARDPLDRGTPRKSLVAFSGAVEREDYVVARRYAQLTRSQQQDAEALLHDLDELLTRILRRPLTSISDAPEGTLDDGLPPDRERIGPLRIGEQELFVDLVRVEEAGVPVWLVSSDTIRRIPQFHALLPPTWSERMLPASVVASSVLGVSLVRVVYWAGSIALPLLLLHLLYSLVRAGATRLARWSGRWEGAGSEMDRLRWPVVLTVTLVLHLLALPSLGSSLQLRAGYARVVLVLLVLAVTWAAARISALMLQHARSRMPGEHRTGARSLMLLGERMLNVLLVFVAGLVILSIFGVDTRTAVAGIGIVGFAFALGARKTIENILGGVMLLGDQAIAIGDECNIAGRHGWVEDITLRSVRIRTREQTLLSIPSGLVADANIENFTSRRKYLADSMLRLALRSSSAQVRQVRDGVEALLRAHREVEQDSARVRLVGFTPHGIELQLHAYFLSQNFLGFLAAREQLLLEVVAIVEAAGCEFAPAPTLPALPAPTADSRAAPEPVPT